MIRYHASGLCQQCTEIMSACPMLVWAQEVLRYSDLPPIEKTGPMF